MKSLKEREQKRGKNKSFFLGFLVALKLLARLKFSTKKDKNFFSDIFFIHSYIHAYEDSLALFLFLTRKTSINMRWKMFYCTFHHPFKDSLKKNVRKGRIKWKMTKKKGWCCREKVSWEKQCTKRMNI